MLAGWALGQRVTDDFGVLHYPNGQRVIDGFGKEYYPNGGRVTNDHGGETVFYELDVAGGAIELRRVRYEFPSGVAVITLAADLVAGRLDRVSIVAVCPSTR